MRKDRLQGTEIMSDAVYVDQAAQWAKALTQTEARGPGDMENAWRRLEARYGVPWRTFWALRYRKPRDLTVSIFTQLAGAYRAECERQIRRLQNEVSIAQQVAGPAHAAVREAQALVEDATRALAVPANIVWEREEF